MWALVNWGFKSDERLTSSALPKGSGPFFSLPDGITQTCLQSPTFRAAQSAFSSPPTTQETPRHHSMLPQMWTMWAMLICLTGGQLAGATLCRTYGTVPGIPGLPGQPGSDGRDGENGPKGEQGKEEAAGG